MVDSNTVYFWNGNAKRDVWNSVALLEYMEAEKLGATETLG